MEGRDLCQNVRVSGYKTQEGREQRCARERERGAPARGVYAGVSDTEGRAGRPAGGRGQPARGGSVPAWSGPIGVVSVKESSLVAELAASSAASAGSAGRARTARGPGSGSRSARPPRRRGRHRRGASLSDRAPDPRFPDRDGAAGARHRGKPGILGRRRPGRPRRSPGPRRDARLGRTRRGLHSRTEARPGPRVPQPGPPSPRRLPGRWVWPQLGAEAGRRRRPDAEVAVLPLSGAGGRAEGGARTGERAGTWARPPRI